MKLSYIKACIHCTQVPETSFDLLFLEQITQLLCIGVPETFAVYGGLKGALAQTACKSLRPMLKGHGHDNRKEVKKGLKSNYCVGLSITCIGDCYCNSL